MDLDLLDVVVGIVGILVGVLVAYLVPARQQRQQAQSRKEEQRQLAQSRKEEHISKVLNFLQTCRLIGFEPDPKHYRNISRMQEALNEMFGTLGSYRDIMSEDPDSKDDRQVIWTIQLRTKELNMKLEEKLEESLSDAEYMELVSKYQQEINESRRQLCQKYRLCQEWCCREVC